MKHKALKLIAVLAVIAIVFATTSCQPKIYRVSVSEIDSIIKANGSVVIQLDSGYEVYPLAGFDDELYKPGTKKLRSEVKSNSNPLLNFNSAQAAPAYGQGTTSGPWVCPKYCAIQITNGNTTSEGQ